MATIQYEVPNNVQRMTIGVQGEANVREFLFDVTEWRQITGDIGTAEMVVQRNGDSSPYAAVITMHDANTVSWIPMAADTEKAGAGKLQLMWMANGQTVKTKIFDMKVDPALDYQLPDDSLDPWASWIPDVINAGAKVKEIVPEVEDLKQTVQDETAARSAADSLLNARIDGIIAPTGEAPSAAEVLDARTGANGTNFASLGAAVRGQVTDLKSAIKNTADYFESELFIKTEELDVTLDIGTVNAETGDNTAYRKGVRTHYRQLIPNTFLKLLNDNWRVAVYWYQQTGPSAFTYLGRTTYWTPYDTYFDFEKEAIKTNHATATHFKVVFLRWDGNGVPASPADVTQEELDDFYSNCSFYKQYSILDALRVKDCVVIAPSDATDEEKLLADYVCTGSNDEIIIQTAVTFACNNNKNVRLKSGNYYIDSFPFTDATGIKIAVAVGLGIGTNTAMTSVKIIGEGYGGIRTYGTNTDFSRGVQININETAYNALDDSTQYAIFGCPSNSSGNRIYPFVKVKFENLTFKLFGNQKKIICIDGWQASALSFDGLQCMAITTQGGGASGLIDPSDLVLAVEGCIGVRGMQGSCYGINVDWSNSFVWGFDIGFHVVGEHIVGQNLGTRYCTHGYVFGAFADDDWVGTFAHPNTLINCCDEADFNMPLFGYGGRANPPGYQAVNLIDFNLEWLPEYSVLGGDLAKEITPGIATGDITFTSVTRHGSSRADAPFWDAGHGLKFKTRNSMHALGGDSAVRNSYLPMYLQPYYDTTLNKLLVYDGNAWKDTNGNAV